MTHRGETAVRVEDGDLRGRIRVMQIIAAAMLVGVLFFLGFVLFQVHVQNRGPNQTPPGQLPWISLLAVAMLAIQAPLALALPTIQARTAVRQIGAGTWRPQPGRDPSAYASDAGKLMAVRQTSMIIALALLEGVAFLGCIAYLLEAQPLALAVVAVCVVLMLLNFPTRGRVEAWLERQTAALEEMRLRGEVAPR
jgi:hypothetical protein